MRLIMAFEIRIGLAHIGPLSKSFSPPLIVFGDGMKLREVKSDRLHLSRDRPRNRSRFVRNLKTRAIRLEDQVLRTWNSLLSLSVDSEMSQRFHSGISHIWICAKIKLGIEFRIWLESFFPANCEIMLQEVLRL